MRSNLHSEWAHLFIRSLIRLGAGYFVVSPGSRSTPLALAIAREASGEFEVVIDERSAAFVALGHARKTGRPAVLLCTSGTAGAHYYPAIIEASEAHVPLIAITADRPWEAVHTMASQTIDQRRLFGAFVRGSFELGIPDLAGLDHLRRFAAQVMHSATSGIPGPVHVNAAFRKPLEPIALALPPPYQDALDAWSAAPAVALHEAPLNPGKNQLDAFSLLLQKAGRIVLVAGPSESFDEPFDRGELERAVDEFCESTGAVSVLEPASGLGFRNQNHTLAEVVTCALRDSCGDGQSTLWIQLGRPPTSAAVERALKLPGSSLAVVSRFGFPDPNGKADALFHCAATKLLDGAAVPSGAAQLEERRRFRKMVAERMQAMRAELRQTCGARQLTEPSLYYALSETLAQETTLLLGNSLVIRDYALFAQRRPNTVLHQRGVAGIDGLVAAAYGARNATPAHEAVVVVLGDVSVAHDLASLTLWTRANAPLVAVVVNNGGGRIFDELPIANTESCQPYYLQLFRTPLDIQLGSLCKALGIPHRAPADAASFREAVATGQRIPSALVIEAFVDAEAGHHARGLLTDARKSGKVAQ